MRDGEFDLYCSLPEVFKHQGFIRGKQEAKSESETIKCKEKTIMSCSAQTPQNLIPELYN